MGQDLEDVRLHPQKRRLGFELSPSGHHFTHYAKSVVETLEGESRRAAHSSDPELLCQTNLEVANLAQVETGRG